MSLPILPSQRSASNDDLIRFYHRTELHWARQIAEETVLDAGTAFTNPQLPKVWSANLVMDASVPPHSTPADAVAEVDAHFAAQGLRCAEWILNPAVPVEQTAPLAEHLLKTGHTRDALDIMYLAGQPAGTIREVAGLQIIPARASFRHARELVEQSAAEWSEPQIADAEMMHLEDPQTDALIALKDGKAAALVSVLTVGEIGCIEDLFVAAPFRRQGIGRTMMSRALEICARSLFKHVFLEVYPDRAGAVSLYKQLGFHRIGSFVCYVAPGLAA